ncbi:hypothetical protein ANO14919_103090 [Xylariales sp. No.14919]|nr:hypothetical protein ANO14919_103090 [Xylariales sp. No.14919]
MCHFRYWGYDVCCHEYESHENQWHLCFLGNSVAGRVIPRHCPFASYSRYKIGADYCDSCLDETPPNHPPVTEIIQGFSTLRTILQSVGFHQGVCIRFTREYRAELRNIREDAAIAGVDNNFYNDVRTLYQAFHQRVADAIAHATAAGGTADFGNV